MDISLGTILIRNLVEKNPELVESVVMGDAILQLNIHSCQSYFIFEGTRIEKLS